MFKKLDELSSLLKQFKASIKMPKMEGVKPMKAKAPQLPGLPAASKKDPVKVAQQIENADIKPIAVKAAKQKKEALSTSKNGQWSLGKTTDPIADTSTAAVIEKADINRTAYKFKHAATADGHSSYHVMHDGDHVGTLSVAHKNNSVSGQLHPSHEGHRDFLGHAVKAFHIAKHTNTDN
jgi:hypothetical protein